MDIEKILEAVLFSYGEGLTLEKIAKGLNIHLIEAQTAIDKLAQKYRLENRGMQIVCVGNVYQMATNPTYSEYIENFVPKRNLSLTKAQLEVLAIIAYKQPVTKGDIEQIRGVDCSNIVNRLLEHNLVEESGRLQAPGRPILFVTTAEFLRHFGISSVNELPVLERA
jgi:segregation and condensation protein B